MGCCQFLAAKLLSCSWSSPRSGGAANNGPITLKRKRAHRSWERTTPERLDIAPFIFSPPLVATLAASTTDAVVAATGILCGSWNDPSHTELLPCRGGGDRPQELEHSQHSLAPLAIKCQPQR